MKKIWIVLIMIFSISVSTKAQVKGPDETNKQAKIELTAGQKKESERIKREEINKEKAEKEHKDFEGKKKLKKRKKITPKTKKEPEKKEFE